MALRLGFILACFIAACFAYPNPQVEKRDFDPSDFYLHLDTTRLVGATPAPVGSVPYMVALTIGTLVRSFLCGGSVVTTRHILTAAHCIDFVYYETGLLSSLRGTVGTNVWYSGGVGHAFSGNFTHEHYVSDIIKNDIGFLVTAEEIVYGPLVSPVGLDFSYVGGGHIGRVAGWGAIGQNQAGATNLLELYVQTITGNDCSRLINEYSSANGINAPPIMDHIEICTFHSNGHGNCNGDSGSAIVGLRSKLEFGIVSWGFPCARGVPDMFVRVSGFKDWIENVLATPI